MKANELRIGNYVYWNKDIRTIEAILPSCLWLKDTTPINFSHLESIPLTKEWLLKFGFESWNIKGHDWICQKVIYKELDIEQKMIISASGTCSIEEQEDHPEVEVQIFIIRPDIIYLHQLQNLYFALTGEEIVL